MDYLLRPDSSALMRVHSILWFGTVAFFVELFYRQFQSPAWIAGLAALSYTVDESFFFPAASIVNRDTLISLFFSVLAMTAHDR